MNIPCLTLNEVLGDEFGFGGSTAIDLLSEVEVIFGRDVDTQEVFLVYGRDRLAELTQQPEAEVDVLVVDILRQTDELDQLLALVQIAKQGYDYVEVA